MISRISHTAMNNIDDKEWWRIMNETRWLSDHFSVTKPTIPYNLSSIPCTDESNKVTLLRLFLYEHFQFSLYDFGSQDGEPPCVEFRSVFLRMYHNERWLHPKISKLNLPNFYRMRKRFFTPMASMNGEHMRIFWNSHPRKLNPIENGSSTVAQRSPNLGIKPLLSIFSHALSLSTPSSFSRRCYQARTFCTYG